MEKAFGADGYRDVPGLCKVASRAEIATQELELLNAEAARLQAVIAGNVSELLEA
jgi:type I restriction enzyme M protein